MCKLLLYDVVKTINEGIWLVNDKTLEEGLWTWIGKAYDHESLLPLWSLMHDDDVHLNSWLRLDYISDCMMNVIEIYWLYGLWDRNKDVII